MEKYIILSSLYLLNKDRGFTIWNLRNIAISMIYSNKRIDKFNANNSAAALFGITCCHMISPDRFMDWLKKEDISLFNEKAVHFLPFLYYLWKGEYSYKRDDISAVSLLYNIFWSWNTGKDLINKGDVYAKCDHEMDWWLIWMWIIYGHFFNTKELLK